MTEQDSLVSLVYWKVVNGFEIRVAGCFFWLNFFGIGFGRFDPLGLGRRQAVRYWRKSDREWSGNPW